MLLYRHSERFRNIVHGLWGLLKRFWPLLLGPVGIVILAFKELYQRFEFIRKAISGIVDVIGKVAGAVGKIPSFGFGGDGDGGGSAPRVIGPIIRWR